MTASIEQMRAVAERHLDDGDSTTVCLAVYVIELIRRLQEAEGAKPALAVPQAATCSRPPLVRAVEGLGIGHPLVERVAKLIGDAMADAYRDAEEMAAAEGAVELLADITCRRLDMTGQRKDTRVTA